MIDETLLPTVINLVDLKNKLEKYISYVELMSDMRPELKLYPKHALTVLKEVNTLLDQTTKYL